MYFLVDWIKRIDFDQMRMFRTARLKEQMREFGLDGLMLFKVENMHYATGVHTSWMPSVPIRNGAVISKGGETPVCFVASGNWSHRAQTTHWLPEDHIKPFPLMENSVVAKKNAVALRESFQSVGITKGKVGVDLFPIYLYETLREEMPQVEFVDANPCMNAAVKIKNEEELKCFLVSGNCLDVGMDKAIAKVDVGVRECEVLGAGFKALYNLGVGMPQGKPVVSSGAENLYPLSRLATDRQIQYGDMVYIDFGGCFNNFWGELARTVVCGKPHPRQKEIYRGAYAVLQEVIKTIRPGITNLELFNKARLVAKEHGLEEYLWLDLGHGIGVSGWETPVLGEREPNAVLEKNMTLVVKVIISVPAIPGGGTVGLSELVIVDSAENKVITTTPYDQAMLD